jgi:hypothetical protein
MSTSRIATLQQPFISSTQPSASHHSSATQPIESSLTLDQFHQQMQRECCEGSAIAPSLTQSAVTLVSDLELLLGGDVNYPIHEALGWQRSRFPHQAHTTQYAALFQNEDGSTWQAKLARPLWDKKKGKSRKYETPVGQGARAFLPAVTLEIWVSVAQRFGVTHALPTWVQTAVARGQSTLKSGLRGFSPQRFVQAEPNGSSLLGANSELTLSHDSLFPTPIETPSFWNWVQQIPQINLVLTEGGKKALSLLTQGYVALALYGVDGGCLVYDRIAGEKIRKLKPELIADLQRFATPGRRMTLAFDQDENAATRHRVNAALGRLGGLLCAAGCNVRIAQWNGKHGKGVDDLIVNGGAQAWDAALAQSLPVEEWFIWNQLERKLTWKPSLRVHTPHLTQLHLPSIPQTGIVALQSAKGTEKTKLMVALTQDSPKLLAITNLISLARNLAERLLDREGRAAHYRGDLDRAKGSYISPSGYATRLTTCLPSLLVIDPEQFRGCDLVLDEAVQLVRCLIQSSICNQDGKRPALLARLEELLKAAGRVILADADLDDATLRYLRKLRGDETPVFLIRNDYTPVGYSALVYEAPDRSAIVADLIEDIEGLAPGKMIWVATDSKALAKTLEQLITELTRQKVFNINSDTSGGEFEQAFMKAPDAFIPHLQQAGVKVILCTPSVATGLSAEIQGVFHRVYGLFMGVSLNDADMAQILVRLREPVERRVWCAPTGRNFAQVSQATTIKQFRHDLERRTTTTVRLIRSSLRPDVVDPTAGLDGYAWSENPHVEVYSQMSVDQNRSMGHLRAALTVRLKHEGNRVTVVKRPANHGIKERLKGARAIVRVQSAQSLVAAEVLGYADVLILQQKAEKSPLTPAEHQAMARFWLADFYGLSPQALTTEEVLWDGEGKRRAEIIELEALLHPELAMERTLKGLETQSTWNQGNTPWDLSGAALRLAARQRLGLLAFLEWAAAGNEWVGDDDAIASRADLARQCGGDIKLALRFSIRPGMSNIQIVHQLLSQVGIKFSKRSVREQGKHQWCYRLDIAQWEKLAAILQRRTERRQRLALGEAAADLPPGLTSAVPGGDHSPSSGNSPVLSLEERREWAIEDAAESSADLDPSLTAPSRIRQMQQWLESDDPLLIAEAKAFFNAYRVE